MSWEEERKILIDRIERLERIAEAEEKRKKKNNIALKGLKVDNNPEEEVRKLVKKEVN